MYKICQTELNLIYLYHDLWQNFNLHLLYKAVFLSFKPGWHLIPTESFINNFRSSALDWISFNCCFHLSYIELYWQAKVAWADAVTNCDTWCLKKTEKLCHWLSQFNTTDQLEMRSGSPHPFWHQELVSWKTIFPQIGAGDRFGMIQVHYVYCVLYFYYCISSTSSDYQAFDPRDWGPFF